MCLLSMKMGVGIATGAMLGVGVVGEDVVSVAVGGEDTMGLMPTHSKMVAIIMKHPLKAVVGFTFPSFLF